MYKPFSLMLISTFLFSLMGICVKLLSHLPVCEVVFFRGFVTLLLSIYFLKRKGVSCWGKNRKILLLRGVFGTISLFLFFTTLHNIPFASAVAIQYLAPIFTAIVAVLFLKEKVTLSQWFFFSLSFAGILIIKGFDLRVSYFFLAAGIASAISSAFAYNCIGKLKGEDPQVVLFYFPMVTVPVLFPALVLTWVSPSLLEWILILLVGVIVQGAQYSMTLAYQRGEVSSVSIMNYVGIFFAILYGWLFFEETINLPILLGILLVLSGVLLNTAYKEKWWWFKEKEKDIETVFPMPYSSNSVPAPAPLPAPKAFSEKREG